MSAYIVTDNTIRYLVQAAAVYGVKYYEPDPTAEPFHKRLLDARMDDDKICQYLLDENYRSVNARYNETEAAPEIKYRLVQKPITPVQVLKACGCYDYQCCETEDWRDTPQYIFIQHIQSHAISRLAGYDEAGWGLDD